MMRKRKTASVVSGFLQEQYGIRWKDIGAKLRGRLLEKVEQVACNLCGSSQSVPVATSDKYGLPLTTVICRQCGLLYLNPRPTAATYQQFYEEGGSAEGVYHRQVDFENLESLLQIYYGPDFKMDEQARDAAIAFAKAHTTLPDKDDGEADTDGQDLVGVALGGEGQGHKIDYYARHIYEWAKHYVPAGGKVFEPGASAGKMLVPWKVLHGCEVGGVEPKKMAVALAKENYGIELLQGFSDDPSIPEGAYDLVLNTRTINHMLDPLGDLRRTWRWLKPGGILCVDIQDAIQETRYEGFERNVVEFDHPYMFSLNTLSAMVQMAGFEIVKSNIVDLQQARDWDTRPPQVKQIRIIARKSEASEIRWPDPLEELSDLMRAQSTFDAELQERLRAQLQINHKVKERLRKQSRKPRDKVAERAGRRARLV